MARRRRRPATSRRGPAAPGRWRGAPVRVGRGGMPAVRAAARSLGVVGDRAVVGGQRWRARRQVGDLEPAEPRGGLRGGCVTTGLAQRPAGQAGAVGVGRRSAARAEGAVCRLLGLQPGAATGAAAMAAAEASGCQDVDDGEGGGVELRCRRPGRSLARTLGLSSSRPRAEEASGALLRRAGSWWRRRRGRSPPWSARERRTTGR